MPRFHQVRTTGLSGNLSTNEKKAAQHLIGHFNFDSTADNEAAGKAVYVNGNTHGTAVPGASVVNWNRNARFQSMRIDRQGFHTEADPGNPKVRYRMCRYALQWGGGTFASVSLPINVTFGRKAHRRALNASLDSDGANQVIVIQ